MTGPPIPYDVGAWGVNFYVGNVNGTSEGSGSYYFVWCVRGPMNADAY